MMNIDHSRVNKKNSEMGKARERERESEFSFNTSESTLKWSPIFLWCWNFWNWKIGRVNVRGNILFASINIKSTFDAFPAHMLVRSFWLIEANTQNFSPKIGQTEKSRAACVRSMWIFQGWLYSPPNWLQLDSHSLRIHAKIHRARCLR